MSSAILQGGATGTGSMTILAPNTNSTLTATLPAVTGTIAVSANQPAFYAYSTGAYTAPQGSNTLVSVNTSLFDTNSCFNTTGSSATLNGLTAPAYSFTPNVAGYYQFSAGMQGSLASNNTSAYWLPFFYKNGSLYAFGTGYLPAGNGNTASATLAALIYLNGTGDYIQLLLGTNNGGTWTAANQGTTYGNWFSAVLVRSA